MRIVCPSCEAEYDVPDSLLGGRPRHVRCAKCAREWAPFAPPPAPPEPVETFAPPPAAAVHHAEAPAHGTLADQVPPIEAPKRKEAKVPGSAPGLGVVIAWLFTAAIIAAGVGVLWLKRAEVVSFWPPARRLYILLGLDF